MNLRKRLANKINFNTTDIIHLCSPEDATDAPFTMKLSKEEIQSYDTHPFEINVPCHTQSVKRNVKLTTECAGAFAGAQNKDGYPFNEPLFFYKYMEFSIKAFAKHIYMLIKTHQSIHVLKICAYSCIYC